MRYWNSLSKTRGGLSLVPPPLSSKCAWGASSDRLLKYLSIFSAEIMLRYGRKSPVKIAGGMETHACTFEYPTLAQVQLRSRHSPPSDELLSVEILYPLRAEKIISWCTGCRTERSWRYTIFRLGRGTDLKIISVTRLSLDHVCHVAEGRSGVQ